MKIYQVYQYDAMWGEYDHIVGSYLKKERAEEVMAKCMAEDEEKHRQSLRCGACPLINAETVQETEDAVKECSSNCKDFVIMKNGEEIDCENWVSYYDIPVYQIKEVEVEE